MRIHEHKVEVESVLADAQRAADYGSVAASDSVLRELEEKSTARGTRLNDDQLARVANIRRTSRINGIERLFEQAQHEADDGLVVDSDFTTGKIRTYAKEAEISLTSEQEAQIKSIFRRARANAIDELIPEAVQASKHGRLEFVDGRIERVLKYAEEAALTLSEVQDQLIKKAFRRVRKEIIEQALKKGVHSEDRELLKEYATEAGLKLSKKVQKRLEQS